MACKVHRIRFYNPKPQNINCISFNKSSKLIAVSRGDASIEIWDINFAPYLLKFIPGIENGSIEALGWVNNRLLSTGLSGALIEWDLDKLCPKTTTLLTGTAAWCLDVYLDSTLIAVGTEQGYVNLYNGANDEIVYKKLFDKQEGRILCCKFDKSGSRLVTGSIDTVRVWNVETGHAITRMSVARRGMETVVWSVAILSNNIVVCGDSHGRLSFWDSEYGEQIDSYITHKADILSIAVDDEEKSLFCSGVDPVIVHFVKVNKSTGKQSGAQWVKNVQRNIHEHDVRALTTNREKLISVGADGYLTFSSYPPKWVMRVPPMIPSPRSSISVEKKLMLLRFSTHLEVWQLGSYVMNNKGQLQFISKDSEDKENTIEKDENNLIEKDSEIVALNGKNKDITKKMLKIKENPVKLASIQSKGSQQIQCCQLSPSGEIIVYSTNYSIRMLKLETDVDQSNTSLSKILTTGFPPSCDRVAFTQDSKTMILHSTGTLYIIQVDAEAGATVVHTMSTEKYLKSKSVLHLHISKKNSANESYLVVADTEGAIAVWKKKTKKFEHHITLPNYRCVPSALTVDCKRNNLIVVYVDQKIVEYDLNNKKFTDWPGMSLPAEWNTRKSAIVDVTVHPQKNALVLQDETSLWVLERRSQNQNSSSLQNGEPQTKKNPNSKNQQDNSLKIIPIKYLAGFHWLNNDEAVSIEILPENIVSQLPVPVLTSKKH